MKKVQLNLLVILNIGFLVKIARSIYLPAIDREIANTGPIKIGITLRYFDFSHQFKNPNCDVGTTESAKCDPLAILRVCPLKSRPTSTYDELAGLRRVFCQSIFSHISHKEMCAVLVYRADNVDYRRLLPWRYIATSEVPFYTELFEFSGILADRDGYVCRIYVHEHRTYIRDKRKNLYMTSLTTWKLGHWSFMKFQFIYRCDRLYHGIRCWYYCRDIPKKQFCVDSTPYCIGFWDFILVRYKLLFLKNETKEKHECWFYNKCKDPSYKCPVKRPICFPSSNFSVNCVKMLPMFKSNIQKVANVTSNFILYLENITCDIYLLGFLNDYSKTVNWVSDKSHDSNPNIFGDTFHVSRSAKYTNPIHMQCIILYLAFNKIFNYHKYFYVLSHPTKVILYKNKSNGFRDIYLGQWVECHGDSEPFNITVVMHILTQNFKIKNSYKITKMPIQVPDNAELGFLTINCSIRENFDGLRKYVEIAKTFHIGLKSFVYFKWFNNYKNQYLSDEYVGCVSMSFISNKIMVHQTMGKSFLNVTDPSHISLDVETFGQYRLLCYMEFYKNDIIYTKIKDFDINRVPNYLCFQMFPPIRGSIIRCDHNGYPIDAYKYSVTLRDASDSQSLAHNDDDYDNDLRIPYQVIRTTVEINCQITDKIDSTISIQKKLFFTLIESGDFLLRVTDDMLNCLHFGTIPDEKDMEMIGERSFFFKKASLFLDETPSSWAVSDNIFSLAIFLLVFCIMSIYQYIRRRMSSTSKMFLLTKETMDRCQKIYRCRNLNDRLNELSREMRFGDQANVVKLFEDMHLRSFEIEESIKSLKDFRVGDNEVLVYSRPSTKKKEVSFKSEAGNTDGQSDHILL